MDISDFPPLYRETWSIYEALRRFGFKHEEIFICVANSVQFGPNILHIFVRAQDKEFIIPIGNVDQSDEEVSKEWYRLANAIGDNVLSDDQLEQMWRESQIGQSKAMMVDLGIKLKMKGFLIPALAN